MNILKKIKHFFVAICAMAVFFSVFNAQAVFATEPNAAKTLPNSYIVKFVNQVTTHDLLQNFENFKPLSFEKTYQVESYKSIEEVKNFLKGEYVYIQPEFKYQNQAISVTVLPNDPGFTTSSTNTDKQWGLVKTNFIDAWEQSTGNSKVVVAVVDTGIDATHEDLIKARFIEGYDFINNKFLSQRINSDDNGHGTLVAGVIAATSGNRMGVAGAASGVSLMPVKALDKDGVGDSAEIAQSIKWAADRGANIINLSLGGIGFAHDNVLSEAISYAFEKDVVIVAAAGNDVAITGGNLDNEPVFPICNDNGQNMVVGVTATDYLDQKPDFANYGKACVDVAAPGKRILSTINHDPSTKNYDPDQYAYGSGTSLAAPFVSAQAALLKSLFPLASNRQIRNRILSTADNIDLVNTTKCGGKTCNGMLGSGRINVYNSIKDAIPTISDGDVVRVFGTDILYLINGGKKQFISPFVKQQLYSLVTPKVVSADELAKFSEGSFAAPKNGTLVKTNDSATVYYIDQGFKLPVSYQVFTLRGFNFANVVTLSQTEVNSWVQTSFLTPPEGSLIRTSKNPTVYWVVGQTLHAINYNFYIQRGLNIFPVIYVSPEDLSKFSKGDSYIL